MKTILVTIRAPRTVKVRVPAGLTPRQTLIAATDRARQHIILQASLPGPR
jgi:hypothetical protein